MTILKATQQHLRCQDKKIQCQAPKMDICLYGEDILIMKGLSGRHSDAPIFLDGGFLLGISGLMSIL